MLHCYNVYPILAPFQCLPNTCTVPMLTCYLHCSSVYPILALFQCLPNTCTVLMFSCSGIAHKTNLYWYNTRGNALLCCTGIVHRNTIRLVQHMRLILHWYNIAGGVYCIGSWYSTRDWYCSGIAQGTVCRWIPKIRDTRNACSARALLCPARRALLSCARRALLYTVAEEIIGVPRPALWPRGRGITHTQI